MFSRLSVKWKLGLLLGMLCLMLVGVGLQGLHGAGQMAAGMRTIYEDRVVPLRGLKVIADEYAVNVIDAVNKANAGLLSAAEALGQVDEASRLIGKEWKAYMATTLTEQEARLASEATALFEAADAEVGKVESFLRRNPGDLHGKLDAFDGPLYASIDPISDKINALINLQLNVAAEEYARGSARAEFVRAFSLTLMVLGTLLALVLGSIIIRGIVVPLRQASALANRLAEGDLSGRVTVAGEDEIGQLLRSMQRMVQQLSHIVSEVNGASDALASASEEVAATAQALSQGTSEQAASVEETTASIEQMLASIDKNAEHARVTDGMSAQAFAEAREGREAVTRTVDAMKSIADKISIIDTIAYQTNLLALNAAIEAARAGDHGKGFAVVATEVRKLAERSQIASREIGEVAQDSVELAGQAGRLLDALVPSIQQTSTLVQEIAAACGEQATGAAQITRAMEQLNSVTQHGASSSEELASTAEEMSGQAQQLQQIMAYFKVGESRGSGGRV